MISLTFDIIYFCTILVCCCSHTRSAKLDNITTGNSLNDGLDDYLESPNKKFRMGFFQPEETSLRRYVGIWYTIDPKTIVWVANRDTPVRNSTGFLTVSEDGNAKLLDEKEKKPYFSTGVDTVIYIMVLTEAGASQTALMLLDSGNVVLINLKSRNILWQSFDIPIDTFLPGMTMGPSLTLTSWSSPEDPGLGTFQFQTDPLTNRYSILNGSATYHWKSGNMSKNSFDENQIFSKAFSLLSNTFIKQRPVILRNGKHTYENYTVIEPYTRLVMNYSGNVQYFSWREIKKEWVLDWQEPKDACSVYRVCGSFGMCNPKNHDSPLCSCMPGFEPISPGDYKAGCRSTSEICDQKDTFLNISMISIDDTTLRLDRSAKNESFCIKKCLEDCHCLAYSYSSRDKGGVWDEGRDGTYTRLLVLEFGTR